MKVYNPQIAIPTIKGFLYGDSGAGKTSLLATAEDDPRTSPMLMLTCMGNPESIRKREKIPTILELEATEELNPIYDWIMAGQNMQMLPKEFAELGLVVTEPFKSVALDSLTEYQRIALDEITGNKSKKIGVDLKAADRQQWGQALSRLTRVARLMFRLPISVFMTALETHEKDKEGNFMGITPSLWGQADREVPSYSLLSGHLIKRSTILITAERTKYKDFHNVLYIDEGGTQSIGSEKYGGLPKEIGGPTIPKILDAIYGPSNIIEGVRGKLLT